MWLSEDKVPKGQQKQMKTHQNKKGDKNMAYHSLNPKKPRGVASDHVHIWQNILCHKCNNICTQGLNYNEYKSEQKVRNQD